MSLISPREARMRAGLPALRKTLPAKDKALYAALESAKQTISSILTCVDADKIECKTANDVYKVSCAFAALMRSQIDWERWSAERIGLLNEAKEQLSAEIRNEIEAEPELRERLVEVVERARLKVQNQGEKAEG